MKLEGADADECAGDAAWDAEVAGGCFGTFRSWCTCATSRARIRTRVRNIATPNLKTSPSTSTSPSSRKCAGMELPKMEVEDDSDQGVVFSEVGGEADAEGLTLLESVLVATAAARTDSALAIKSRAPSIRVLSCSCGSINLPPGVANCDGDVTAPYRPRTLTNPAIITAASSHGLAFAADLRPKLGQEQPELILKPQVTRNDMTRSSSSVTVQMLIMDDSSSTVRRVLSAQSLEVAAIGSKETGIDEIGSRTKLDWKSKIKTKAKARKKQPRKLSLKSILKHNFSKNLTDKQRKASTGNNALPPVILISASVFDEKTQHTARSVMSGLVLHNCQRRESFLYKSDSEYSQSPSVSRHSSIAGTEGEDYIVTPFAQILATLKNVRSSYLAITNLQVPPKTRKQSQQSVTQPSTAPVKHNDVVSKITNDDSFAKVVGEILEELDWCLEQLESLQTQRSVSDLASNKFKRLLTKELSIFEEQTAADTQISKYICNTFLDKSTEIDLQDHNAAEKQRVASEGCISNGVGGGGGVNLNENSRIQTDASMITMSKMAVESMSLVEGSTDKALLIPNNRFHHHQHPHQHPHQQRNQKYTTMVAFTQTAKPSTDGGDPVPMTMTVTMTESVSRLGVETDKYEELCSLLDTSLDKWGMNMFEVASLSNNRPITVMLYTIFERRGFMQAFKIDPRVLINCASLIEFNYHNVPYHNRIHGADVTQSINVQLSGPTLTNVFTDLEQMAAIFAGAIHDVDHPGFTNQFLINSGSELALMYNDESVLENHHLAVAFKVLQNADADPFRNLSIKQRQTFRRMVIDMVLATDMQKHMKLLADLKTMVETKRVSGGGIVRLDNYNDRIQILQNLVHCADLANPTKPLDIYLRWVDCIMDEFWLQGDTERERKLEISPMCDRYSANVDKSQMSFIDFIVHPLWETWCELVYPDAQEILDMLDENRDWYQKKMHPPTPNSMNNSAVFSASAQSSDNNTITSNTSNKQEELDDDEVKIEANTNRSQA